MMTHGKYGSAMPLKFGLSSRLSQGHGGGNRGCERQHEDADRKQAARNAPRTVLAPRNVRRNIDLVESAINLKRAGCIRALVSGHLAVSVSRGKTRLRVMRPRPCKSA